jgi:hypothetical protein
MTLIAAIKIIGGKGGGRGGYEYANIYTYYSVIS